jgi:uncharacterized protein
VPRTRVTYNTIMNTQSFLRKTSTAKTGIVLGLLIIILIAAQVTAHLVQRDFGRVTVSNVKFTNENDVVVRAKLMKPVAATGDSFPAVVFVHGYQNNRETSDAYCIELARRGFVVLNIDAVGRGNSGEPAHVESPDFDTTYGARSAVAYLRSLPHVRSDSIGLAGHSLGAEMAYEVALDDPGIAALLISGFAYTDKASFDRPRNMLMIIGKWDEFRDRMTGVDDIEAEWMSTAQTKSAIDHPAPEVGLTYGDFADGTARRVIIPPVVHVMESHSRYAIGEALEWMRSSLEPDVDYWKPTDSQIWHLKEWMTLIAMLACFASLLPLGLLLVKTPFYAEASLETPLRYSASGRGFRIPALINGLLMCLYLPLILVLFAVHIYLVPIDRLFPMMMVNGVVWWFLLTNLVGFVLFVFWYRKARERGETDLFDLGISYRLDRMSLDLIPLLKSILLAVVLFAYALGIETTLEKLLIVDFRFVFPFASDFTWHRSLMFLTYFPFLLIGFLCLGMFLHGRVRRRPLKGFMTTYFSWSATNILVMTIPVLVMLAAQYVPLVLTGTILFVGPGGMFVTFVLNLFHIAGVLILIIPISTWFYRLTGRIYTGAVLCALIVAWMFTSSQVIAPIPV